MLNFKSLSCLSGFRIFYNSSAIGHGFDLKCEKILLNVLNLSRVKSEKPGEPRSEWIEFAVLTGKAGCSWFRIVLSTVLNSETTSVCSVVYYHIKLSGCLVVPVWSLGAFRLTDCGRCWLTRIASACSRFLSTARRYCTVPARDNRWYDLSEYLVQVWKNDVLTIIGDGLSQRWLACEEHKPLSWHGSDKKATLTVQMISHNPIEQTR